MRKNMGPLEQTKLTEAAKGQKHAVAPDLLFFFVLNFNNLSFFSFTHIVRYRFRELFCYNSTLWLAESGCHRLLLRPSVQQSQQNKSAQHRNL